jgi:uncharacterized protein YjbI with pentapeptide repeats
MSEQQATSACPHPEAVGTRWGDPISEERQAELQGYLDRWEQETDHGERRGPFDKQAGEHWGMELTGADVFWLAERVRRAGGHPNEIHLEGALIHSPQRPIGLSTGAHLEGANLGFAHMEGAALRGAYLERAKLESAHLEKVFLTHARMNGAALQDAHLSNADLSGCHLEGADLTRAYLREANLSGCHLEGASLWGANLEEARLFGVHLEGAILRRAWLDSKTILNSAVLDRRTQLGDIQWGSVGSVNLSSIDWSHVPRLGDEKFTSPDRPFESRVRANRQVAAQLRAQGMAEVADRFAYRANVCQRAVLLSRWHFPQYLGSLFLDLISGYGYRPVRSLIAYVLVILGFAVTYFALGGANGEPLPWNEAIVISMTAFHGRGFFQTAFQPGDLQAAVAAVEAFIGLLIEIVLIATFTQRFFAR